VLVLLRVLLLSHCTPTHPHACERVAARRIVG